MILLTDVSSSLLWKNLIQSAEKDSSIHLEESLEAYLVSLLMRYINKPDVVKKILATAFLEALSHRQKERDFNLQNVGDQCLLFAGLFPHFAEKRHVKIRYFVDLGQSAYASISNQTDDLYQSLALQFVALMDVLQSIRHHSELSPLEAFDLWDEVGSQRALNFLKTYSKGLPLKSK